MFTQIKKRKYQVGPLLSEQLKKLEVQPDGLPSHVVDQLRIIAEHEVAAIEEELTAQIAALEEKAEAKLRKQLGQTITLKAVGKAFALPPKSSTAETPASPPPTASGEQGGAA